MEESYQSHGTNKLHERDKHSETTTIFIPTDYHKESNSLNQMT